MIELLSFISYLLTLYIYILIAAAVLCWLVVFNVVNSRNPIVAIDRRVSLSNYRTGAATDPQHAAKHGRYRHFADHRHSDHLLHSSSDHSQHSKTAHLIVATTAFFSRMIDGVIIVVRLTPKGGRDSIDGVDTLADGTVVLKARVRAAPSEGEANAALGRLVAKALGVPPGRVAIVGGATSRLKRVKVMGDAPALAAALEKIAHAG